jgi:restriction system protein
MTGVKLPTFDDLINPLLRALHSLGGSGSVEEIYDKVVEMEHLPDKVLAQQHDPEKSNMSEVAYRLAWARTYPEEIRPSRKLQPWCMGVDCESETGAGS